MQHALLPEKEETSAFDGVVVAFSVKLDQIIIQQKVAY